MAADSVIGESPAVRVSASSVNQPQRQLLNVTRGPDMSATMAAVGSTGLAALDPLVLATLDGETAFFSRCSIEQAQTIVEDLDDGTLPTDGAMAVTEHESGTATLPIPDDEPFNVGDRNVLSTAGWAAPTSIEDYRADGTYIASAIDQSVDAIARLREATLRGRGRGDVAADAPVAKH